MSSETDKQRLLEILIYMTLGDGSISKPDIGRNSYLEMVHSTHQIEYLRWKVSLLQSFGMTCGKEYFRKDRNDVRVRTERSPLCNAVEKRMYSSDRKKYISKRILKHVDELGLAIWYMDDGSAKLLHPKWRKTLKINGRPDYKVNQFNLAVCCFDNNSVNNIQEYLDNKFNLHWEIGYEKQKYPMLILNRFEQLNQFKALLSPYIIPSMQYKINHPTSFLYSSPEETERIDS